MTSRRVLRTGSLLIALALSLSGCSFAQLMQGRGPAVFGGVRTWKAMLVEDKSVGRAYLVWAPWLLAFFPIDLGVDVLLLPVSTLNEVQRGGIKVEKP